MMMKRLLLPILLACIALPDRAAAQPAQPSGGPPGYAEALELLAVADTAAAIERLWEATREAPDFGPAFLRLGALLVRAAGEVEKEFEGRMEALDVLRRALDLMGDEPEVLLEYGLLLQRRHMNTDARRVLDRAWAAAERLGVEFPPHAAAEMHHTLGRIYETWWEDWQGLVFAAPGLSATLTCDDLAGPVGSIEEAAAACPGQAAEWAALAPSLEGLKSEEHGRMLGHFWQALVLNPAHVDAGVRLLGHLADARDWEGYARVARRLSLVLPEDPRVHLFIGLGLHERGRSAEADTAFQRAVALLPPEERRVFEDISLLLPRRAEGRYEEADSGGRGEIARVLFAGKDPILLTPVEERRLEHYARLAWADLKFGAPASGLRGWETERGEIWIRYGMPLAAVETGFGGGRTTIWSYGEGGPTFRFHRRLTYRLARLASRFLADELKGSMPELYKPRTITRVVDLPVQLVRFRGSEPGLTRLELIAGMPLDSLGPAGLPVETGVFLFDTGLRPLWEKRLTLESGAGSRVATFRVEVPPGTYRAALEARLAGPDSLARPLARYRDDVTATGFAVGELGVSDILLATHVEPRTAEPRTRNDLRIAPNPSMIYAPDQPIALYFELYNLLPDAEHYASYELELVVTVEEIEREGRSLTLLLAEIADKWGLTQEGADAIQLRFRKQANVLARDMVPEFFRIQIPGTPDGRYGLRLTVRDRNADRTVTTERIFWIREPAPEPAQR